MGELYGCGLDREQDGLADGNDRMDDRDRFGSGAVMLLGMRAVEELVVDVDICQARCAEGFEVVIEALTDSRCCGVRQGGIRAEGLAEKGFDVTIGQTAHPGGDDERASNGAERTTALSNNTQGRGEALGGVALLRSLQFNRPRRWS